MTAFNKDLSAVKTEKKNGIFSGLLILPGHLLASQEVQVVPEAQVDPKCPWKERQRGE